MEVARRVLAAVKAHDVAALPDPYSAVGNAEESRDDRTPKPAPCGWASPQVARGPAYLRWRWSGR